MTTSERAALTRSPRHQVARPRSAIDWTRSNHELAEHYQVTWQTVAIHRTHALADGRATRRPRGTTTPAQQSRHGTSHPKSAKARAASRRRRCPSCCESCGARMSVWRACWFRRRWVCPACLLGSDLLSIESMEASAAEIVSHGFSALAEFCERGGIVKQHACNTQRNKRTATRNGFRVAIAED